MTNKPLFACSPYEAQQAEAERWEFIVAAKDVEIARLREALKPFASITPSTLYPEDGGKENYSVFLTGKYHRPEFTGADLARARTALAGKPEHDK